MSQTVTPELRRWIIEQASAGFSPESVLKAMLDAGWEESVAEKALERTLLDHLSTVSPQQLSAVAPEVREAVQAALGTGVRVPTIDLAGSPRRIDAGDRWVDVITHLNHPRVVVLGNLLSAEECDAIIESAKPRLARSLTVQTSTGGEELNPDRTSNGMFFNRGQTPEVTAVEERIARLVGWPVENGEGLQVLHYRPGAEYKPHYDYFDPDEPGTPTILKRGGQRVATLVMYLNEPTRGGGTTFPDVGLEVAPVRGHAVFFSYDRPHPSTRTLHGGAPVLEGEKWVATKWLREGEFK
ncbi:2OG-Fe(II) oxygenase [Hydrogenophaga intermedia]|jgi:prolyl 4-hydroxylase|uniref:2OG-Fe(II) oxygenase n=1 Tax=Hydrogenophaga intermedia TaxID=65786 RepID=UPI0020438CA7|nr:2OG-Fe(II) oxygenase [Hydrogenophaga intermedia]MCM3562433.1 2OG-Fe(II) oxygenase [Hydrogenophaga intermedia]